jgi:hypothetical protein
MDAVYCQYALQHQGIRREVLQLSVLAPLSQHLVRAQLVVGRLHDDQGLEAAGVLSAFGKVN